MTIDFKYIRIHRLIYVIDCQWIWYRIMNTIPIFDEDALINWSYLSKRGNWNKEGLLHVIAISTLRE